MDTLAEIVADEVRWYAAGGEGARIQLYFVSDTENHVYAVNAVPSPARQLASNVVVLAHIVGDSVVIEEDRTDRPLADRLMARGIPREKIVLAYAGETVMQTG